MLLGTKTSTFRNEGFGDRRHGFTLLELLVTIAIIAVLSVAGMGVAQSVAKKGKMVREVAAGKTLITAYLTYAAENDGSYLPGMDLTVKEGYTPEGKKLTPVHAAQRYPYRLAPYFDNKIRGTILVNDNEAQIKKAVGNMFEYGVSTFPAFGINYYFVGGNLQNTVPPKLTWPAECVTRQSQATTSILAFVSGGMFDGTTHVDGYNILTPPNTVGPAWSKTPWAKNSDPGTYGFVDARYDGKAVCVYLDGSVKMQSIEELRDMRLWNRNAALQNNPDYIVPRN